jgi:hypothetical protein
MKTQFWQNINKCLIKPNYCGVERVLRGTMRDEPVPRARANPLARMAVRRQIACPFGLLS